MNKPALEDNLKEDWKEPSNIERVAEQQVERLKKNDKVKAGIKIARERNLKDAEEKAASQLPDPCGYKLLIMLPKAEERTEGGLYKAAETKALEEVSSVCGLVLKMGPDAYSDKRRFPGDPYCKKGDMVMFKPYSGTRFTIYGEEFRFINDDSVDAVVLDPRGIAKR